MDVEAFRRAVKRVAARGRIGLIAPTLGLAVIAIAGCVSDGRLKISYNDSPADLGDGWPVATPESQGFDREKLRQAYALFFAEDDYVTARSLLVVRNGRLVAEGYCRDLADRDRKRALQSATKSVTSLLTGIALDRGTLPSIDLPLVEIFPDKFDQDPGKRKITLRHLLTMQSGIAFSNDDFTLEMEHDARGDGVAYILHKPMAREPGTVFVYQDCDPHLLGAALTRLSGVSLDAFAATYLFRPIGIEDVLWLRHHDGTTYGAYGLYLKPRDMARIGQLVLQKGRWGDRQIVPESWIALSTDRQTDADPASASLGIDYGFYWWRSPADTVVTAFGHGGQYICVAPTKDVVIVLTSEPDTNGDWVEIGLPQFLVLVRRVIEAAG